MLWGLPNTVACAGLLAAANGGLTPLTGDVPAMGSRTPTGFLSGNVS